MRSHYWGYLSRSLGFAFFLSLVFGWILWWRWCVVILKPSKLLRAVLIEKQLETGSPSSLNLKALKQFYRSYIYQCTYNNYFVLLLISIFKKKLCHLLLSKSEELINIASTSWQACWIELESFSLILQAFPQNSH